MNYENSTFIIHNSTLSFLQPPAFLVDLRDTGDGQRIGRYIDGYRRAGRHQRVAPHPDRGHQLHVAADEDIVADHGKVLVDPVIVAGDGAAADVDMAADLGI